MAQVKPLSDAQWKAQHDAQVLMEADEILKNKPRMGKAKSAAKILVRDKKSEVRSLEKVIKKKPQNVVKRTIKQPAQKGNINRNTIKKAVRKIKNKR